MRVVMSTDDFKLRGVSIPGFPFLMWTKNSKELGIETGELFEEGVDFLEYELITRGRVDSKNSWASYSTIASVIAKYIYLPATNMRPKPVPIRSTFIWTGFIMIL